MESLKSIGDRLGTDKFSSDINYTEPYLKYFEPIRDKEVKILEIGVYMGGGVSTWREYFVNSTTVVGMENFHRSIKMETLLDTCRNHSVDVFAGDQSSREDLSKLVDKFGNFDIIVDDGGHRMSQQQISLGFLFEYLNPGGIFVVEDLTSSIPGFLNDGHKDFPSNIDEHKKVTTHELLRELQDRGRVYSPFMTDNEMNYLEDNYETCELFENLALYEPPGAGNLGKWPTGICMITKKEQSDEL